MILDEIFRRAKALLDFLTLPTFANKQRGLRIGSPRRIANPDRIYLGDSVRIGPNSVLVACRGFKGSKDTQLFESRIRIGRNVKATATLQIYAASQVEIEDDVLIAANVFICDYFHGFSEVDRPYSDQPYWKIAPILVGRGSWLGQNVVIMPGVIIGKFCIIGASCVVTKSVPDYSIVVGNPGRVIKQWDFDKREWVSSMSESEK